MARRTDVTTLLEQFRDGEPSAAEGLFPLVYDELRALAISRFDAEPGGHTLQPTAVVHEVYLRLVDQTRASFGDQRHFLAVASTAMRRVLIDHARARNADKRTPVGQRVDLDDVLESAGLSEIEALALDEALTDLEEAEPRMARVVELRFFGGLTFDDIAELLDISGITAKRDWAAARGWLAQRLGHADA